MSDEMTDLQYRLDMAKEVYSSLNKALDNRINATAGQLARRFQFIRLIKAVGYVWKIAKWECEGELIFEEIAEAKLDVEVEVLLNDFNEFLEYHREWIIKYFDFVKAFPNEDAEQMYNVLTYGGEV